MSRKQGVPLDHYLNSELLNDVPDIEAPIKLTFLVLPASVSLVAISLVAKIQYRIIHR